MNLTFSRQHGEKGNEKPTNFEAKIKAGIKIHTIREDTHDRWKPGTAIHFWIGSPRVKSTNAERIFLIADRALLWQKIEDGQRSTGEMLVKTFRLSPVETWLPVCWTTERIHILHLQSPYPIVTIGRRCLTVSEVATLAQNDGFETVEDFFNWFRKTKVPVWQKVVKGEYTGKKISPTEFEGKIIHWTDFCYDLKTANVI